LGICGRSLINAYACVAFVLGVWLLKMWSLFSLAVAGGELALRV
jgi:hypothetical protein